MKRSASLLAAGTLLLVVGAGWVAVASREPAVDMTAQAAKFLDSLGAKQRAVATMAYEDKDRFGWHFIPKKERKGLQLREMSEAQQEQARKLLAAALSQIGYDKAITVMSLEKVLNALQGGKADPWLRDPLRYYWTIFGEPTEKGPWGLSVEGHHLSLNFVVRDGKVAAYTPAFYGANPALVKGDYGAGPKKGTRVLADEELLAFKLVNSLDEKQQQRAILADKAPAEIRAAGEKQPPNSAAEGISSDQLTKEQKQTLAKLVRVYTSNFPQVIAQREWNMIEENGLDKIHFAWAGARKEGIGHYYRVQGPTFLIEFVNTQPDGAGNPANHIHCVYRSMAGDFGEKL